MMTPSVPPPSARQSITGEGDPSPNPAPMPPAPVPRETATGDGRRMRDTIHRVAGLGLLGAAVGQGIAAIAFFAAANWWTLAPAVKTGLLDAALVVAALAAAVGERGSFARAAACFVGAALSGILFAVHGQIWQTGADAWELFAVWTLAAALWSAASGATGPWALTTLLAATACGTWLDTAVPGEVVGSRWIAFLTAGVPALAGVAVAVAGRLGLDQARGRWFPPVLTVAAMALVVFAGLAELAFPSRTDEWIAPPFLAAALVAGAAVALFKTAVPDPWRYMAATTALLILAEGFGIWLVVKMLGDDPGLAAYSLALLALGGACLGGVAWLAGHFRRVIGAGNAAGNVAGNVAGNAGGLPQAVASVGVGLGAWLAALVTTAGLGGLAFTLGVAGGTTLALALALGTGAVAAVIRRRDGSFAQRAAAAFAVIAFMALCVAAFGLWNDTTGPAWAALFLLPLLLAVIPAVEAGFLAAAASVVLWGFEIGNQAAAISAFTLATAIIGWRAVGHGRPSVRGAGTAMLAAAFLAPAVWEMGFAAGRDDAADLAVRLACVASAAVLLVWSGRIEPALRSRGLTWAAGSLLAGSLLAPSGGAAIVGLSATAAARRQPLLLVFGLVAATWSVSRFYYDLDLPLDRKALALAAGAALATVAWIAMVRPVTGGMPDGRTVAMFLACAVVPAAVEYADAAAKTQVVTAGREVLLPMGPRDPRSLVQGDYMALSYDSRLVAGLPKTGGKVLLTVDAGNVAIGARAAPGEAQGEAPGEVRPNEVLVRARPGRRAAHIAPDSFLFEEGHAEQWVTARFVIVRVLHGELVVVGLADADRKPIGPRFAR